MGAFLSLFRVQNSRGGGGGGVVGVESGRKFCMCIWFGSVYVRCVDSVVVGVRCYALGFW